MKNPTVTQIILEYLKNNKFDGLTNLDAQCGCTISDFAPCSEIGLNCQAAFDHGVAWGCDNFMCLEPTVAKRKEIDHKPPKTGNHN